MVAVIVAADSLGGKMTEGAAGAAEAAVDLIGVMTAVVVVTTVVETVVGMVAVGEVVEVVEVGTGTGEMVLLRWARGRCVARDVVSRSFLDHRSVGFWSPRTDRPLM